MRGVALQWCGWASLPTQCTSCLTQPSTAQAPAVLKLRSARHWRRAQHGRWQALRSTSSKGSHLQNCACGLSGPGFGLGNTCVRRRRESSVERMFMMLLFFRHICVPPTSGQTGGGEGGVTKKLSCLQASRPQEKSPTPLGIHFLFFVTSQHAALTISSQHCSCSLLCPCA